MSSYRERVRPAFWWYPVIALIIPASLLVLAPVSTVAGTLTAVVLITGCLVLLLASRPIIEVAEGELRAGRARIPIELVGDVQAARGADARHERGPGLDARAWLVLRGDVDPVARITILDDDDPAPYWLVSTRTPEALIDAITNERAARA
jgi:hypothetical protein